MATSLETVENVILHLHQMYGVTTLKYIHLQKFYVKKKKRNFVKILNRLRKAQCTEEDNRIFESCIIKKILKITILAQDTYFHLQMLWNT